MRRYVIAIAGANHPATGLPTTVDVTFIPEPHWPVVHAAFGRESLAGMWWYAPAMSAVSTIEAAIDRMNDPAVDMPMPNGRRHYRRVFARIVQELGRHSDNVLAVGVEDQPAAVWEIEETPVAPAYEDDDDRRRRALEITEQEHLARRALPE